MGEPAGKRLVRKLDLERFLSTIKPHPLPNASLEQYTTSESVAATILYLAAYTYGDIVGKKILDLGCGTGRLGLGAAFLGAESVVGVDIDGSVVKIASENSNKAALKECSDWIAGDIETVNGEFDTVLQNPPFGVQKRAADRRFLEKAMKVGNAVYSLHNHPYDNRQSTTGRPRSKVDSLKQASKSSFILRLVEDCGGTVEAIYTLPMIIPHIFDFHTKARHQVMVDLYVIRRNKPPNK